MLILEEDDEVDDSDMLFAFKSLSLHVSLSNENIIPHGNDKVKHARVQNMHVFDKNDCMVIVYVLVLVLFSSS